jgi:diguanylate cyclase (GGDEF)-like protein
LEHALRTKARDNSNVALLIVDLDRFKSVNDTFGHDIGDQLIQKVVLRLKQRLRDVDTLARIGGDEFAILLAPVSDSKGVDKVCKDILFDLVDIFTLSGKEIYLGASIGAALAETDDSALELLRKADIAMYACKEAGRNQHKFYTSDTDVAVKRKKDIEERLSGSLASGEGLDVHFQPILTIENEIIGVEGFFRWTDDVLGMVSPGEVIPIAEDCGLIDQISRYVIDQCCDVAKKFPDITISMNLSTRQFRNQKLGWQIEEQVRNHGLNCAQFELEIIERLLIDQPPEFAANLKHLREAGFRIALDDFGTGYSSLNCLHDYEIDTIKLDSSFIEDAQKKKSIGLLRSAVSLGHSSGLRVLAEGIANDKQRDIVMSAGCDGLQGHLIAKPMPRGELFRFFESLASRDEKAA